MSGAEAVGDASAVQPDIQPAKGMLLIARRGMIDPRFRGSVVLLLEHGAGGSLGLIVNRPTHVRLAQILPELKEQDRQGHRLYNGGPVEIYRLRFLVRGESPPEQTFSVIDGIHGGGRLSTLAALLKQNTARADLRVYHGYAGWGTGQLTDELARNDWYLHPAGARWIFDEDANAVWPALINLYDPEGLLVRYFVRVDAFAANR